MEVNFNTKLYGWIYHKVCKKGYTKHGITKDTMKAIKEEYNQVVSRAKDIGKAKLISSYLMAAYFIAMNRKSGLNSDENYEILSEGLLTSKMFKAFMGNADSYCAPKRMQERRVWAEQSKQRKYENDWVLDFLEKTDDYELGYDYHECGVCKLCKDEGCFELAKYLCKMDFDIANLMGLELKRNYTLADGGNVCDFRYNKKYK